MANLTTAIIGLAKANAKANFEEIAAAGICWAVIGNNIEHCPHIFVPYVAALDAARAARQDAVHALLESVAMADAADDLLAGFHGEAGVVFDAATADAADDLLAAYAVAVEMADAADDLLFALADSTAEANAARAAKGLAPLKKARYSAHNCNSACLYARGDDCTCGCGGARHGELAQVAA